MSVPRPCQLLLSLHPQLQQTRWSNDGPPQEEQQVSVVRGSSRSIQEAFKKLRAAFTSAPILRHFESSLPVVLEADASDFTLGTVISQLDPENGVLHPITFYRRKFNSAELNYEIYNKEMLAIVETMDHYRHYFKGLGHQSIIFSDHRNLLWFTETKVYNQCQARWVEKLSRFDFKIVFRPGRQGGFRKTGLAILSPRLYIGKRHGSPHDDLPKARPGRHLSP